MQISVLVHPEDGSLVGAFTTRQAALGFAADQYGWRPSDCDVREVDWFDDYRPMRR